MEKIKFHIWGLISYCYIISLNWHVTTNGDSTAAVLTITTVNLVNTDTEGGVESVEINGGCPYQAGWI